MRSSGRPGVWSNSLRHAIAGLGECQRAAGFVTATHCFRRDELSVVSSQLSDREELSHFTKYVAVAKAHATRDICRNGYLSPAPTGFLCPNGASLDSPGRSLRSHGSTHCRLPPRPEGSRPCGPGGMLADSTALKTPFHQARSGALRSDRRTAQPRTVLYGVSPLWLTADG